MVGLLRGRQLVYEIGVAPEDAPALGERLRNALSAKNDSYSRVAVEMPALLVTAIVADGISAYEAGSLWDKLRVPLAPSREIGEAFERAIVRLRLARLEVFDDLRATRFVSRIIAHGGIPQYCTTDLLAVVSHLRRLGVDTAEEALSLLRGPSLSHLAIDRPVRRFLRDTGAVGRDFLARILLLPDEFVADEPDDALAGRLGLPRHVVSAFRLGRAGLSVRSRQVRVAGPKVLFDPDVMTGPELALEGANPTVARWSVRHLTTEDVESQEFANSPADEQRFLLSPADAWMVDALDASGAVVRTFEVLGPGPQAPFMAFDVLDGRRVQDLRACDASEVWILSICALSSPDPGLMVRSVTLIEEGAWAGWYSCDVVIEPGGGRLTGTVGEERISVSLGRAVDTTLQVLNVVPGITGPDGIPILDGPPILGSVPWLPDESHLWRFAITVEGGQAEYLPARPVLGAMLAELSDKLPSSSARVALRLIGPMGTGQVMVFAIVRRLTLSLPVRALLPGEEHVVRLESEVLPPGSPLRVSLSFADPEAEIELPLETGKTLRARIRARALRWRLLDEDDPLATFSGAPIELTLVDGRQPALLQFIDVDPGVDLSVNVNGARAVLRGRRQSRDPKRAPVVDLAAAMSRLREGKEQEITVEGAINGRVFPLLRVRDHISIVIDELKVEPAPVLRLRLSVSADKPLPVFHVRLRSLKRPWRPDVHVAIPGEEGTLTLDLTMLTDGAHRATAGIHARGEFVPGGTPRSEREFDVPTGSALLVSVEDDPRESVLRLMDDDSVDVPDELDDAILPVVVSLLGRRGVRPSVVDRLLGSVRVKESGWNAAMERSSVECAVPVASRIAAAIRMAVRRGRALTELIDFDSLPAEVRPGVVTLFKEKVGRTDVECESRSSCLVWLLARLEHGWLFRDQLPSVLGTSFPVAGGVDAILGRPLRPTGDLRRIENEVRQTAQMTVLPLSPNNRFTALMMLHLAASRRQEGEGLRALDALGARIVGESRAVLSKRVRTECDEAERAIKGRHRELQPNDQFLDRLRLSSFVAAAHACCAASPARFLAADHLADLATVLPNLAEVRLAYAAALTMWDVPDPI